MPDWRTVRLADIAIRKGLVGGPFGSSLGSKDYVTAGIPVIRGANLGSDGKFDSREFVYVTPAKVERELARNVAIPGDVVFTQRGTLGQVGIVPAQPYEQYVISQSQMRVRLDPEFAVADFIYYQFKSADMVAAIHNHAITTGVPHINLGILGDLKLSLPPLHEQRTISEMLGALDDKIAVNKQAAITALDLALAQYQQLATDGSCWRSVSLADSARWFSGGTPKTSEPSYWRGELPWISAVSLKSPWIDSSSRMLSELGARNGTRIVPKDTVIFVVRGSSLDTEFRIGLTQREVAFGQDCKALRTNPGIDPAVLFIAIKSLSQEILGLVDQTGHGAGRLVTDLLSNVEVSLPTESCSARVAAVVRPLVDLGAKRQAENRALAGLRDVLLPKLMSGEIRVRDAEKIVEDAT
jgi:type I restriction enzyme, S subunit